MGVRGGGCPGLALHAPSRGRAGRAEELPGAGPGSFRGPSVSSLCDSLRAALESVEILSSTPHDALPGAARARLGIAPGQVNLLVRVVLRDLSRTLTADEGNQLRNAIYAALHRGSAQQWAPVTGR